MELGRHVRQIFLFILTATVLWTAQAFAGNHPCNHPMPGMVTSCICDDNEAVVSCDAIEKDDPLPNQEGDEGENKCRSVSSYEQDLTSRCFTCRLFANIMGSVQKLSKNSFEATGDALSELLIIGFLIYIAYLTLVTVTSPEMQKLSKFLTDLLIQGAKVAIAVMILQHPSFLYGKLLAPILESSVDFGMSLTGTSGEKAAEIGKKYAHNLDYSNEYFSFHTAQTMIGAVENFSNGATTIPAIGRGFLCNAWNNLGLSRFYTFPWMNMLADGGILYLYGIGLWLAIGFYILDCAIELGIVCALMAFFVACWPFKMTAQYTKVGWNMFLNVFFNFVMMGIIVAIVTRLSAQILSVGTPQEQLIKMINSNDVGALENAIEVGGLQMLMVIACCLMCFKLPQEASKLAGKFSQGAPLGMGSQVGGTMAGVATGFAVGQKFGKEGQLGGAAGLLVKGGKAWGSSVAEHTGMANAFNQTIAAPVGNFVDNVKGNLGGGKNAKMVSKGRNENANNQQSEITNGFKKDT